jgi:hypothetical protein
LKLMLRLATRRLENLYRQPEKEGPEGHWLKVMHRR